MTPRPPTRPARTRGFTLIELVVAMLVAGVLVAMATASYLAQTRRSRRVEAKTAVLDLAGREERNYSTTNTYSAVAGNLGYAGNFPVVVGGGYYQVTVAAPVPAAGAPATFTITATPLGNQTQDTSCASFSVDQTGAQSALSTGAVDTTATCWR